ncbi:MAG: hypothetical protein HOV94_16455, partial [Saccharothrix sp.]|nr:hypothetical protein [Saccharothrix sp.]
PAGVVLAERLTAPWRGIYGGRDPITPPDALQHLRTALADTHADTRTDRGTVTVFPDLDHGFALDDADPRHAPVEAAKTWRDTVAFLGGGGA